MLWLATDSKLKREKQLKMNMSVCGYIYEVNIQKESTK